MSWEWGRLTDIGHEIIFLLSRHPVFADEPSLVPAQMPGKTLEHHSQAWDAGRWFEPLLGTYGLPRKSLSSNSSSEFIGGIPVHTLLEESR
jgi:hypothetical protein